MLEIETCELKGEEVGSGRGNTLIDLKRLQSNQQGALEQVCLLRVLCIRLNCLNFLPSSQLVTSDGLP